MKFLYAERCTLMISFGAQIQHAATFIVFARKQIISEQLCMPKVNQSLRSGPHHFVEIT
jgi:hypothetical protein